MISNLNTMPISEIFFEEHSGKTLVEAIMCWKYKKGLCGHNTYEKSDLVVLD